MILTKEEKAWVKKLNKHLAACPSTRLAFYTGGDPSIIIVDKNHQGEIDREHDDPLRVAARNDWIATECIEFPSAVHAVCV